MKKLILIGLLAASIGGARILALHKLSAAETSKLKAIQAKVAAAEKVANDAREELCAAQAAVAKARGVDVPCSSGMVWYGSSNTLSIASISGSGGSGYWDFTEDFTYLVKESR